MSTRAFAALAAVCLAATSARAAEGEPPSRLRASISVGTTAVAANNVLPAPLALGGGVLLERGMFGAEAAMFMDAATLCDMNSSSDGYCGLLWIWDVAARFTPLPDARLSPYASVRFQLTDSRPHGLVPAMGPRLGVRYRGQTLGAFLEAGPSFVSSEDGAFGQFVSGRRWFPQASVGMTFAVR